MYITEKVTIASIGVLDKYPYVRIIQFKDRLYRVIIASNTLYEVGEEVLFFPDGTELPEWMLKKLNMWDSENNRGFMGGKTGRVVKPYYFARDPQCFSSGFIYKLKDGKIDTPDGLVDITDPEFIDKIGIRYISKGNPYYFVGDFFYMDVPINRNTCPELEAVHTDFLDKYVYVQEYISGRKFYVTIHRYKAHHHAIGENKNVFICADNYGKYRYLQNTKANMHGNLFMKYAIKAGIPEVLHWELIRHSTWTQITLGIIIKSSAFGATNKIAQNEKLNVRDLITVADTYIGEVPWGRFLSYEEHRKFCMGMSLPYPINIVEDYYDFNYLHTMANDNRVGLVIKTPDGNQQAALYSEHARMTFVHKNS